MQAQKVKPCLVFLYPVNLTRSLLSSWKCKWLELIFLQAFYFFRPVWHTFVGIVCEGFYQNRSIETSLAKFFPWKNLTYLHRNLTLTWEKRLLDLYSTVSVIASVGTDKPQCLTLQMCFWLNDNSQKKKNKKITHTSCMGKTSKEGPKLL